jgi:hypothetical protein
MGYHRLFHYTDKKGADAIRVSKILKQSERKNGDSAFGDGVYFTKMSHLDHSKVDIVMNNWGADREQAIKFVRLGKVDYVVQVMVPDYDSSVTDKRKESGRDVWLYEGDVYLVAFEFEIIGHHCLFHYTNEEGAAGIRASRKLKQFASLHKDSAFGTGVYFTKKSP